MYRILYNESTIFDPYGNENEVVTDASMSVEINAAAYLDFTMSRLHPLYDTIAERDGVVTLYWDQKILFQGVIESIDMDIQGNKSISCVSALDYLNDTVVRPYSTIAGEQELTAPSSVDGYFQWLIDQHNDHVLDAGKLFDVGVNQGANLQQKNFIYRSSTNTPTTASEITDQLLDSLGGYLTMRYVDDRRVLDLYSDIHTMNAQIIDFGVNITDFSKTIDTKDQYTALLLKGGSPEFLGGDFEDGSFDYWVSHPNTPIATGTVHGGTYSSFFTEGNGEYINSSFFYAKKGARYKSTVWIKNERSSTIKAYPRYQVYEAGDWVGKIIDGSYDVPNDGEWHEYSFDFMPNLEDYVRIRPRWVFDTVGNDGNKRVYVDDFDFRQVEGDTDVTEDPISVAMVPDGGMQYDTNILKTGDVIYDPTAVARYGYKEKVHEDSTITDVDDLLQAGVKELNKLKDPQIGLDIKAVDLALFMDGYDHLNVGDAVRVRSAIHDTDEFLMVTSITLDLQDPGQSEYNIGKAYDSLTGQQSGFLRSLNSGINSSLDAVASLDQTTKDQVIQLGNVENVANQAKDTANNAQNTANSNKEAINSIKDAQTEYEKQLEQMQQGVADAEQEIGQINGRIEGMNSEIESAKSNIDSLRSSTEARTTATSAYQDAQSALTQSSVASQTANAVKTELETKYSTTDEIAEQYATKSLVEQTSQSITSTVEATYATKATVEALENIANNAVQTWMGSGVPTLSNKPASDWTTAELKSQHSGDIYYDTNTGYSYRFGSSDSSNYSWSLIKDTDISKAVADAAKAQQTAEGVSDEVIQLKTDIPATYATKTEVKQTTDSIKSTVSEVASTANSALSKATTVEQTANGLQTTVTEQAEKLDGAVTTISQVSQKVDSVSSTITQVQDGVESIVANGYNYIPNGTPSGSYNKPNWLDVVDGVYQHEFPGRENHVDLGYQNLTKQLSSDRIYLMSAECRLTSGSVSDNDFIKFGINDFDWQGVVLRPKSDWTRFKTPVRNLSGDRDKWFLSSYMESDGAKIVQFRNISIIDVTETDNAQSTANSALSQSSTVQQELTSFKTSVQQTYETKNDALSKQSSLQQSVNNLRTEVSETYTTKTEFDNLQIGGTNLIRNSNFSDSRSDWSDWGLPSTREIVTINSKTWAHIVTSKQVFQGYQQLTLTSQTIHGGEPYTFSCLAYAGDSSSSKFTVGIHIRLSDGHIFDQFWYTDDTLGSDPKRIVHTFAIPENCERFNVMVGYSGTDSVQNIYFTDIKLEVGAKPTDWSPAPEDMLSTADAAQTYSTKSYVDQTARTVSLGVVEEYKNGQHGSALATQSDITAAKDSITSTVSQTYLSKNDASVQYATKTQVQQTSDSLTVKIGNILNNPTSDNLWPNQWFDDDKPLLGSTGTENPPSGGKSRLLASRDHFNGLVMAPVYPGHRYRITADAKRTAGSVALNAGIWYTKQTSGHTFNSYTNPTSSSSLGNDWNRYTWEFTVPSGKQAGSLYFQLEQDGSGGSTKWLVGNAILQDITAVYNAQSTANTANSNAQNAQSTANTANSNATNAQNRIGNLETCIKMTSDGVRVGKIENGNFTGYSALVNSAGSFDILNASGTAVAKFSSSGFTFTGNMSMSGKTVTINNIPMLPSKVLNRKITTGIWTVEIQHYVYNIYRIRASGTRSNGTALNSAVITTDLPYSFEFINYTGIMHVSNNPVNSCFFSLTNKRLTISAPVYAGAVSYDGSMLVRRNDL